MTPRVKFAAFCQNAEQNETGHLDIFGLVSTVHAVLGRTVTVTLAAMLEGPPDGEALISIVFMGPDGFVGGVAPAPISFGPTGFVELVLPMTGPMASVGEYVAQAAFDDGEMTDIASFQVLAAPAAPTETRH